MMDRPLMPKATAVWLVENTSLTFDQIAEFCGLHPLEVKGIADGEVGAGIRGLDPVASGQLERSEIERAQKDTKARLKMAKPMATGIKPAKRRGPRYTPLSNRQDRRRRQLSRRQASGAQPRCAQQAQIEVEAACLAGDLSGRDARHGRRGHD